MKTIFSFIFIFLFSTVDAQDSLKLKQINALVSIINTSIFTTQRDTLVQDHPDMGLKMTTYLTMLVNGNKLMKYVNLVNTTMIDIDKARQMTTSSSFYYQHNKLIKVEEYIVEDNDKKTADWYYSDDKPLYNTLQTGNAAERAALLLTMSKEILKKVIKK